MKTLSLILLAAAAGFSALAQPGPGDKPELPPTALQGTLTQKPVAVDWSQLPPASTNTGVTFATDIAPIFKVSCVRCHGAQRPRAGLRLDSLEGVLDGTEDGPVLKAGDSANSLLVKSISQLDPKIAMPPKPRGPRGQRGPGGPGGGADRPPEANASAPGDHPDGPPPPRVAGGDGDRPPGGPPGTNGPGQPPRRFGPPPKPLTAEQVGLVRAWIDQGAK